MLPIGGASMEKKGRPTRFANNTGGTIEIADTSTAVSPGPMPESKNRWWAHLRDTGCRLHPKCLECPLPVCREDTGEQEHNGGRPRRKHILAIDR